MELYLMQHGSCLSKEIDPEMPLSPVGRDQIRRSAAAARMLGLGFDRIVASPKLRARQTAQAVAEAVGYPVEDIVVGEAVKAMSEPARSLDFLRSLHAEDVLVCGHLPNLALLASYILCGDMSLSIAVENGGLTCIELPVDPARAPLLRWHLSPMQLQLIAGA